MTRPIKRQTTAEWMLSLFGPGSLCLPDTGATVEEPENPVSKRAVERTVHSSYVWETWHCEVATYRVKDFTEGETRRRGGDPKLTKPKPLWREGIPTKAPRKPSHPADQIVSTVTEIVCTDESQNHCSSLIRLPAGRRIPFPSTLSTILPISLSARLTMLPYHHYPHS